MTKLLPLSLCAAVVTAGCAATIRHDAVGSGNALVYATEPATFEGAGKVSVDAVGDAHRVEVFIDMPRAVRLRFAVRCPNKTHTGTAGETFDEYKARRLATLARERAQKKRAAGNITNAIVGRVGGDATVATPHASASASAEVEGRAVGEAVAEETIEQPQLSPSDTGARRFKVGFGWRPEQAGPCSMAVWSDVEGQDISGVTGSFTIHHVVDLRKERRKQHEHATAVALDVRARVRADLVARGADPTKRDRERKAAEAERVRIRLAARLERDKAGKVEEAKRLEVDEAREAVRLEERRAREAKQLEVRITIDAEARVKRDAQRARERAERDRQQAKRRKLRAEQNERTRIALGARGRVVAWLAKCGGDPHRRARERERIARRERKQEMIRLTVKHERRQLRLRKERAERERRGRIAYEKDQDRLRVELERDAIRLEEERQRRETKQRKHDARLASHRTALEARARIVAALIAGGADPDYQRKKDMNELREFEARAQLQIEAKRSARASLEMRTRAAVEARASIVVWLHANGAVSRPAQPAPPSLPHPAAPSTTSVWIDGQYSWSGFAWEWQTGYWTQPPSQGAVWVAPAKVVVKGVTVVRPGAWLNVSGKMIKHDHRKTTIQPRVRDHRQD